MSPPAIESAVQTTPPIRSAASIPAFPESPAFTRKSDVRMSVIRVIPETGFVPTVAIARAATDVKRKEMTTTTRSAMSDCVVMLGEGSRTPNRKKAQATRATATIPPTMTFIGRSRSVRSASPEADFAAPKSALKENAFAMTRQLRRIPRMPAAAMPPMPMCLT